MIFLARCYAQINFIGNGSFFSHFDNQCFIQNVIIFWEQLWLLCASCRLNPGWPLRFYISNGLKYNQFGFFLSYHAFSFKPDYDQYSHAHRDPFSALPPIRMTGIVGLVLLLFCPWCSFLIICEATWWSSWEFFCFLWKRKSLTPIHHFSIHRRSIFWLPHHTRPHALRIGLG